MGRGAAGEGKRGGPPLYIGLAGALFTFSFTNLYLQVVVRSELFDKNTVMLAVRILIQSKYDVYLLWC